MTKRRSVVLFCLFFLTVSCSSSKQAAPLDENLVFNEDQSDLIADLDFSEDESDEENEDAEFAALDSADEPKENTESSDSDEDFNLFDDEEGSTDTANAVVTPDEDNDENFNLFDDDEDENLTTTEDSTATPPLALDTEDDFNFDDEDESLNSDGGFESPLDVSDLETSDVATPLAQTSTVLSIDYNALQKGGSFIVSTSGEPSYETEFIPETNQYVLKLKNAKIGKQLLRPFLTKDFRQSFEAMNSYRGQDGSVKFVFQLKPNSYPRVAQVDNRVVIEPGIKSTSGIKQNALTDASKDKVSLSATSFEDFLLDNSKYVGEPVSIHVKDESVVTIIQFISEQVGANIVISETVKGKISIKLKDVPWDQALVSIMKAKGLGYVRNGNILRVSTLEDLQQESLAAAKVQETRKTLAPFHVKVFPLSYAKPATVETKVKAFLTVAATGSTRAGQVLSEERSSSLIVRDTLEVIKNISALIKELDRPPLQVMIKAKIVEANKNFTKTMEASFESSAGNQIVGGQTRAAGFLDWATARTNGAAFVPRVTLGGVDFLGTLNASLRLQEINSNVKILSSPSILVVNNEKAKILQSDQVLNEVVINDQAGNSTTTVERNPVELSLEVTPQVSADSNVIMEIEVKRQFPRAVVGAAPPISSREAKTKVIIGNNRTAMIGGVYQVTEDKTESGTPYLRKIPLLKWLFQNTSYNKTNTELVIFITPRVVNPNSLGGKHLANQKLSPSKGKALSKLGL